MAVAAIDQVDAQCKLGLHVAGWTERIVRGVAVAMAGAYFVLTIIGGVFADSIIFQPPPPGYRDDASVLKLTSADGARISAKYFPNANAKFTLLFRAVPE